MIREELIAGICEKLLTSIIKSIEIKIKEEIFVKEAQSRIRGVLDEYRDESFYMGMDRYLTNHNIIQNIMKNCQTYLSANKVSDLDKLAEDFYEENKKELYYFSIGYLKEFFNKLFLTVFQLRFKILEFSSEEAIVAQVKYQIQEGNKNIENMICKLQKTIDTYNHEAYQNSAISNDKKFQFVNLYKRKLFLEDDNEDALTLKDVYIVPKLKGINNKETDINNFIDEFLFRQKHDNILFIVGAPSIGKSSLICDLVYRFRYRNDIIALKMKGIDGSKTLLNGLRQELRCNDNDLENKVLILDGYDEASVVKEKDANINKNCLDFVQGLQGLTNAENTLKAIITVRTEFFDLLHWTEKYEYVRVIELQDWDKGQIKQFEEVYAEKKKLKNADSNIKQIKSNNKNLGIVSNPMMLYMLCHYKGKLGNNMTKAGIYEKIFSRTGSLFLNLYKGKGQSEDKVIINKYYNIISSIAFEMFKKNVSILSGETDQAIALNIDNNLKRFTGMTFEMKNKNEITNIEFRHISILNYFVAEHIYDELKKIYESKEQTNEYILRTIEILFSSGNMREEVFEFLLYFIEERKIALLEKQNKVLLLNLEYVLKKNCIYSLDYDCDLLLLDRIHNIFNGYWKIFIALYKKIYKDNKKELILNYIIQDNNIWKYLSRLLKNGSYYKLYLKGSDFRNCDMRNVILRESDLSCSDLRNVDLRGASLVGTRMCDSTLDNANLNGADLCKANFDNASIYRLRLRGSVLKECKLHKSINIDQVKFSYLNIIYVKNILEADLIKCFVYDEQGKMQKYIGK